NRIDVPINRSPVATFASLYSPRRWPGLVPAGGIDCPESAATGPDRSVAGSGQRAGRIFDAHPVNRHWYHWEDNTLHLYVHIHPGAKTSEIRGLLKNRLRLRIKSPPAEGKANRELIAMLARDFSTGKSQIIISSGTTGRDKHVEIHSPGTLPGWFHALIESQ